MKDKLLIALSIFLSFLFVLNIANALESNIDSQEIAQMEKLASLN